MDRASLQEHVNGQARFNVGGDIFSQTSVALFGPRKALDASETIAARLAKPGQAAPKSRLVVAGEAPKGFGKQVLWDPADKELAVVIFVNPGDHLGVMISGVRATDTIEFISATGLGSFAEETENEGVSSIIGIVAAGANVTAAAFGAPEARPIIDAGASSPRSATRRTRSGRSAATPLAKIRARATGPARRVASC